MLMASQLKPSIVPTRKQGTKKNQTSSHQACIERLWRVHRDLELVQKQQLSAALLELHDAHSYQRVVTELNNLSLPELKQRAEKSHIAFDYEDEDAWDAEHMDDGDTLHSASAAMHMDTDEDRESMRIYKEATAKRNL
jgi:hypothetical protein